MKKKLKLTWLRPVKFNADGHYIYNPKKEYVTTRPGKASPWVRKLTPDELASVKASALARKKSLIENKKQLEYLGSPLGVMESRAKAAELSKSTLESQLRSNAESLKVNIARVVELTKEKDTMQKTWTADQTTKSRLSAEVQTRALAVSSVGAAVSALGPVFGSFAEIGKVFAALGAAIAAGGKAGVL